MTERLNFRCLFCLGNLEVGVDVTDYVECKIKSLCAQVDEDEINGEKTNLLFFFVLKSRS